MGSVAELRIIPGRRDAISAKAACMAYSRTARAIGYIERPQPTAEVEAIKRAIRFTRTCLRFAVTGAVVYGVCWAVQAVVS